MAVGEVVNHVCYTWPVSCGLKYKLRPCLFLACALDHLAMKSLILGSYAVFCNHLQNRIL